MGEGEKNRGFSRVPSKFRADCGYRRREDGKRGEREAKRRSTFVYSYSCFSFPEWIASGGRDVSSVASPPPSHLPGDPAALHREPLVRELTAD